MRVPQVGDTLGRYVLAQELGRGGMAVVFRAQDPTLNREVAIKVMHAHLWGNEVYAARFAREARAVAALRHPNIVEIHDFCEGSAAPGEEPVPGYIVSEFVRGMTLREFLDRSGHPLPEVAAMVALKLAEALQCAHARSIIHRDLKPENVMIAEGGRVVLTDFGIARIAEGEAVTQTGALIGSPAYMSPEQARGLKIDARSDLFSLGTVLYLLSTGSLPFPGKDPISTVLRILEGKYDPPLRRNPQLGTPIDRVIRQLLQIEVEKRYASAEETASALRQLLVESGISDVDDELKRYFSEPGPYNKELVTRVIDTSLHLASEASSHGDYPRALSFCDRVLAFEPDHPTALELMARISARGLRWWHWLAVGVGLVVLAGGGLAIFLPRWGGPTRRDARVALPASRPDVQVVRRIDAARPDLARRDAALPDAGPPDARGRKSKTRRRVDAATGALARPDARIARRRPDAGPRPTTGELLVSIGPWCDVVLDGRKVGGQSPWTQAIPVTPGTHTVVCRQGSTGPVWRSQQVTITAGKRTVLTGLIVASVKVRLQLRSGDAVRIDGQVHRTEFRIAPKRYRVDVLKGGQVMAGGWVGIGAGGCTLVDLPQLQCQ
jgi:serine/threonine protein kinase